MLLFYALKLTLLRTIVLPSYACTFWLTRLAVSRIFWPTTFSTNVTVTCLVKRQELRTLTSPDQQSSQVTLSYVRADISMKWLSSQTLLFRNRRSANGSQTILVSARTTSSGSVCAALLKLGNQS